MIEIDWLVDKSNDRSIKGPWFGWLIDRRSIRWCSRCNPAFVSTVISLSEGRRLRRSRTDGAATQRMELRELWKGRAVYLRIIIFTTDRFEKLASTNCSCSPLDNTPITDQRPPFAVYAHRLRCTAPCTTHTALIVRSTLLFTYHYWCRADKSSVCLSARSLSRPRP